MDRDRWDYLIEAITEYERMDYEGSAVTQRLVTTLALHSIAFSLENIAESLEEGKLK